MNLSDLKNKIIGSIMYILSNGFYFMRHGETEYNIKGLVTGTLDIPLNENGKVQAKISRGILANLDFSCCVVSPMQRAMQTAEISLNGRMSFSTIDDLKEHSWGNLSGTLKSDLDKKDFDKNNVEKWECFFDRTIKALSSINKEKPLIVAHSGTYRVLVRYLKIVQKKLPVLNAWPYYFYQINGVWYSRAL